jgi:hypothetical protein
MDDESWVEGQDAALRVEMKVKYLQTSADVARRRAGADAEAIVRGG